MNTQHEPSEPRGESQANSFETVRIDARVEMISLDEGLARLDAAEGRTLFVTDSTPGINLQELQVGQVVQCEVYVNYPKVVRVKP